MKKFFRPKKKNKKQIKLEIKSQSSPPTLSNTPQKTEKTEKTQKSQNQVFGIDLETITQDQTDHVPYVVKQITKLIETEFVDCEGIFRIPGSKVQEKKVIEDVNENGELDISTCDDPYILASLLKYFFYKLPQPLLTFELFDEWNKARTVEEISNLVNQLPLVNRCTLKHLMKFCVSVSEHCKLNKMNSANLARVIGPNLFRHPINPMAFTSTIAIDNMIIHYKEIFEDNFKKEEVVQSTHSQERRSRRAIPKFFCTGVGQDQFELLQKMIEDSEKSTPDQTPKTETKETKESKQENENILETKQENENILESKQENDNILESKQENDNILESKQEIENENENQIENDNDNQLTDQNVDFSDFEEDEFFDAFVSNSDLFCQEIVDTSFLDLGLRVEVLLKKFENQELKIKDSSLLIPIQKEIKQYFSNYVQKKKQGNDIEELIKKDHLSLSESIITFQFISSIIIKNIEEYEVQENFCDSSDSDEWFSEDEQNKPINKEPELFIQKEIQMFNRLKSNIQNSSSIKIQKQFRGFLVRKEIKNIKKEFIFI
ncbi:rho gtpase-activating protein 68f [Anaeramoeba ignava]|uniref:Rho gtpase-activating protein 68f n=1 Tax=Anaeramoeba ignava TaxID=1746090 RepID=A0A9Q0R835_ANAIG|nr:rho gtpase-activating protein 68f [Anaeramoeba ignava]